MIFAKELQIHIIRPALEVVGLWSKSAERLMLGTAVAESNLQHLVQVQGPARGFFQIEPYTHADIKKWLNHRQNKALSERVLSASYMAMFPTDDDCLIHNLRYATLIARIIYYRSPKHLPVENDAKAMAQYHKQIYNTVLGRADVSNNEKIFQKVIDEV